MRQKVFQTIINSGVKDDFDNSKRRAIIYSNYIALILGSANILLLIIPGNRNLAGLIDTLFSVLLFSFPIVLNRLSFVTLSRIYLCWMPPIAIVWSMILGMRQENFVPVSTYDGLRIYLLAASCIPYLLLDRKNIVLFLISILPSLLLLVFTDYFLDLSGVGFSIKNGTDPGYALTQTRILIAYVVIGGSCISLKLIVDKSDQLNQFLIKELEQKNVIIQTQADNEVNLLNTRLHENLSKLLKYNRELTLLNTVSDMLSKVPTEQELFKQLCEILVNDGGYQLVWIAQMPTLADETSIVKKVISHGPAIGYLQDKVIDLNNENHRKGPTAQILLKGETRVTNQLMSDPNFEVWRAMAAQYGLRSSMGVCIKAEPVNRYALNVYSGNPDSFDTNEVSILERIAINVAHTIKSIDASNERNAAKKELQRTYERINYHVSNTPLAVIERDRDLKITYWNKRAEELFGWTREEAIGKKSSDLLVLPDEKESTVQMMTEMDEWNINSSFLERKNIHKDGKVLHCKWYYSMLRDESGKIETVLSFVSDLTAQKAANEELQERIKELTTMYRVSQMLSRGHQNIDNLLQTIVHLLPLGWQYPEICAARIQLFGKEYQSINYRDTPYKQTAKLEIRNENPGFIEVVYLESRPPQGEGPFLLEERSLINVVAEMLQIYLDRMREEAELHKAQANLKATINNTATMIWSVDRNYNLTSFNEPFYKFNADSLGLEVKQGANLKDVFPKQIVEKWDDRYLRALSGEAFVLEETTYGIDFRFSFTPIVESGQVIGVSVFADNMTERNQQDRELREANKLISNLKLMALRSVMNPHFIFNVLNSIQFFIAKNDRQNAINYLSMFSKLIRSVLTHSVAEKIKLTEELELMKNYIELEKVRFDDKFTYQFVVDDEIEVDTIDIPSLLVQPYIENAILHGLYNKEGQGRLIIRVRTDEDYLIFEIEDNGIGRVAAQRIKEKNKTSHKSMGTKLTEERLRVFNNRKDGHDVMFEDLMEGENPAGTRVIIKVKI